MFDNLLKKFTERYLNKKDVMYRLPAPISIDTFWPELVKFRKAKGTELNHKDQSNKNFWFTANDQLKLRIEKIDNLAVKDIFKSAPQDIENAVISDALIDEAFNSSVIEGAFSTKKRTKEMVEKKIKPTNKSEQMIINNHAALEHILENLHKPLDEEMILSIYRILTENTLDAGDIVDKYRNDAVIVWDATLNKQIYEAPHHTKVQQLMDSLIEFIHTDDNIHPIIKACIIHFYFVYVHPFFDGNGRTARAISYMYLLQNGYDFFKFFSISSVINDEKNKYYKAIKDVEDYESDITYFVDYYTEMINTSIVNILNKFKREYGYKLVKRVLESAGDILPTRLNKALEFYLKREINFITVNDYQEKFKVAYETARTDLLHLEALGILRKVKSGKKFIFILNEIHDICGAITEGMGR